MMFKIRVGWGDRYEWLTIPESWDVFVYNGRLYRQFAYGDYQPTKEWFKGRRLTEKP